MDLTDVPIGELRRTIRSLEAEQPPAPMVIDLLRNEIESRAPSAAGGFPLAEAQAWLCSDGPPAGYLDRIQFRPGPVFGARLATVAECAGLSKNEMARRLAICGLYGIDYGTSGRRFDALLKRAGNRAVGLAAAIRQYQPGDWEKAAADLLKDCEASE